MGEGISYDLLLACHGIASGTRDCVELLGGKPKSRTQADIPHLLQKRVCGAKPADCSGEEDNDAEQRL